MEAARRGTLPIEDLIPHPRNDRIHNARQIAQVKKSLQTFGQTKPILVRAANKMIIAGHAVWQSMQELGRERIDVVLWDVDQDTADRYLVADNRLSEIGDTDLARRRALLESLAGDVDYEAIGFLPAEVEELLADGVAAENDILVEEIDTGEVADKFWIQVAGPLASQALALRRLQEVMKEIPGVEVELGTVSLG
jgi:ParB-like chromosome segregation protein Spo0J